MKYGSVVGALAILAAGAGASAAGDWTGYYVGGHLGNASIPDGYDAYTPRNGFSGFDLQGMGGSGMSFGVHGGRNWDLGNYVVGVELAYSRLDIDESSTNSDEEGSVPEFRREVSNLVTLMPRVGIEVGNSLIYGKAGLAMTKVGSSHDQGPWVSGSGRETGWAVGIGAELPLTDRLTGRVDYTIANFGDVRTDIDGSPDIWTIQDVKVRQISVGINYYFN